MKLRSVGVGLWLAVWAAACGIDATEASDQTSTESALTITLSLSPAASSVAAGASSTSKISLKGTGTWALSSSALPAGVSAKFSATSVTSTSPVTLTLWASTNALIGKTSFTITGTSGTNTRNAIGSLTVTAEPHDAGTGGGAGGGTGGGGGGGNTGVKRVLFDAAHKQVVGNADWVLDTHFPTPSPTNPTTETSWNGGISAWGFDLVKTGRYSVAQLSPGASLSWGGGGEGDLQGFEVFISDEPELNFSATEQSALMQFAHAGGGIFLASDHSGATRCTTCTQAWQVINNFVVSGAAANAFGVKCDGNDIGSITGISSDARFTDGPFGHGTQFAYHSGSSVSATASNAFTIVSSGAHGMMVGSEISGGGRIILVGDSSPLEDGTCQCSAKIYNGWSEADDSKLVLNATAWLAKE